MKDRWDHAYPRSVPCKRALQALRHLLPRQSLDGIYHKIVQGARTGDLVIEGYGATPQMNALVYATLLTTNPYWQAVNPDMARNLRVIADENVPVQEVKKLRSVFPRIQPFSDIDPRRLGTENGKNKMRREPFGDDKVLDLLRVHQVDIFLTHDVRDRDPDADLGPLHRRVLRNIVQDTTRSVGDRLVDVWRSPLLVHLPPVRNLKNLLGAHREEIVLAREARRDPVVHVAEEGVFSRWRMTDLIAQGREESRYPLLVDLERRYQAEQVVLDLKEKLRTHLGVSRLPEDRSQMYAHFVEAASLQFLLDRDLALEAGLPSVRRQEKAAQRSDLGKTPAAILPMSKGAWL